MPDVYRDSQDGLQYVTTRGGNKVMIGEDTEGRVYFVDAAGNFYYDTGSADLGFYVVRLASLKSSRSVNDTILPVRKILADHYTLFCMCNVKCTCVRQSISLSHSDYKLCIGGLLCCRLCSVLSGLTAFTNIGKS